MAKDNAERELLAASQTLVEWRREHGGRGRPIPDAIWRRAVEAARTSGVGQAARALRLDPRRLQARMTAKPSTGGEAPDARFVEITGLTTLPGTPCIPTVVELTGRDGERLRLEAPEATMGSEMFVALARAFWRRGS